MNQKLLLALHEARNKIHALKGMIHFHMYGEDRFKAEQMLEKIAANLNVIYESCLKCDEDDRRES